MARIRSRTSSTATAPSARISCSTRRSAPRARAARTCRSGRPPATSTPSRPTSSRRSPATSSSSGGSARSTAGTRWRRWCGATRCRASTAGTSRRSPRRRCSTTSGSTISGGRAPTTTAATWCSSRATRSPASTRGRSWRGGSREETLDNFRSETGGKGLSSYPHPWLMPDYWQFPTVSMGLGPLMAIYQARFMKYMHNRGLIDMADRKVWAFLGDGEMDEPESLGAIGLAAREGLDNLIFVVNCNLQRLDGPVRGNSQDHPGARGRLPRRRLERHQADLGLGLGQAAGQGRDRPAAPADGRDGRRRLPDLQVEERRLHPRAFLRQVSGDREAGRGHDRRRDLGAAPRRARPAQGLRRLRPRGEDHGPADGAAGQDRQGLRHGRCRRRPEHHPPAEEDGRGPAARPSATASTSRCPRTRSPRRPTSRSATSRRTTS